VAAARGRQWLGGVAAAVAVAAWQWLWQRGCGRVAAWQLQVQSKQHEIKYNFGF
jgi:hypothetical protein